MVWRDFWNPFYAEVGKEVVVFIHRKYNHEQKGALFLWVLGINVRVRGSGMEFKHTLNKRFVYVSI